MNRVHPKELLGILPEDLQKFTEPAQTDEGDLDPGTISEFSWKIAVKYVDKRIVNQFGRSEMYLLDGRPINDDSFLEGMTREICQEYSLLLLDIIADLILPIGFKYPSLLTSLHEVVNDGFKPVSSITQRKTVVWVDDIHWNNPKCSIVERIMFELLMKNVEPFLVAPKYFDQEALSMLSGKLVTGVSLKGTTRDSDEMKRKSWDAFSTLLRFGFMLLLRASNCSLVVLQVNQKIAEIIDAYALLDLAESEGHCVMSLKNTATTPEERNGIVKSFVEKVVNTPSVQNQISTSSSRLPTGGSSASSSELSSLSSRAASDDNMADDNDHLLETMSLDDFAMSDSEEEDSFEDSNFAV